MIMKKLFAAVLLSLSFVFGAFAQNEKLDASFVADVTKTYRSVRAVARVRVTSVRLVEDKGYITYAADGEIVESFKGKFKRGRVLKYYFVVEPMYNASLYPKDSIVFLEGEHPVSSGGTGWFELENSHLPPTPANVSLLRAIKNGKRQIGGTRRRASSVTERGHLGGNKRALAFKRF